MATQIYNAFEQGVTREANIKLAQVLLEKEHQEVVGEFNAKVQELQAKLEEAEKQAMSEIRNDFDKALRIWNRSLKKPPTIKETALWAAKWMAERCAQVAYDDELDFKDAQIESLQSDRTDQELLIAQLQARVEAYERALEAIACKEPYHNLDGYCCRAAKVLRTHKGESR